jgi:GNAT superfamily N-acetyltransferase
MMADAGELRIRVATAADVELLFGLILELAGYEKLADEVSGDAEVLRRTLFEQRAAEALIVEDDEEPIGYAIFFTTFSSFECRSGIWLEDVYVRPERRRGGVGRIAHARAPNPTVCNPWQASHSGPVRLSGPCN